MQNWVNNVISQFCGLLKKNNFFFLTASLPGMWERTVTIGSAGKTFSATGWKVSWPNSTGFIFCNTNCLYLSFCLWLAGSVSAVGYFRFSLFFGHHITLF